MKSLRPAFSAVILTALLSVPAHADHKRFGGFFVEPFYVPLPQPLFRGRLRQQDGYPVALVRQRLRGIGFYGIGQFDVYRNFYSVTATDPGGVRVRLGIDRWTGDIVRVREIGAGSGVRPYRPPAVVDRVSPNRPTTTRKTVAMRVPPLPRPAPERLTQTASVAPTAVDPLEPADNPLPAVEGEETATSSIEGLDAESEIYPIGKPVSAPPSPPVADAEAPPTEPSAPVEVAALPKPPAIAEAEPAAGADTLSPAVAPKPARPATVLQGERFDPADGRNPIAKY